MRKAPSILFVLFGLLVLIVAAISVFLYVTHLQAAKDKLMNSKSLAPIVKRIR